MNAPDPLFSDAHTNPQRWNRYAYVMNNPLRMTDPSGMDMVDPNAAINQFYQDVWGTMAWDDFTYDYWAQGTGYSYGFFSSREIAEAAGWGRNEDNGPTGEVWSTWDWAVEDSAVDAVLPIGSSFTGDPPVVVASTAAGAAIGATVVFGGTLVVDAATGGFNILATPAEVAAGAAIGGAVGWGFGTLVDGLGTLVGSLSDWYFSKGGDQNIVPSWVTARPDPGQSGKDFAREQCDEKYPGGYSTGPGSDYSKIKKAVDRGVLKPTRK